MMPSVEGGRGGDGRGACVIPRTRRNSTRRAVLSVSPANVHVL